jgi:hypothetical protein
MRVLHEIFVEQVMKTERFDASNYRPTRLKARLRRDYPQLVFHRHSARNRSELVFVEELSVDQVSENCGTADSDGADSAESDSDKEIITVDCERSLLSAGLDFRARDFRARERKGGTADNTLRNEIRVAHTTQNSHWSKSIRLSIKSDT